MAQDYEALKKSANNAIMVAFTMWKLERTDNKQLGDVQYVRKERREQPVTHSVSQRLLRETIVNILDHVYS